MFEECMQGIMMVSKYYKDGVYMVNRGYLAANMQFQLEDKASRDRSSQDMSSQDWAIQESSNQDKSSG